MKYFYERYWENKKELEDFRYKWPVLKKFIPTKPGIKMLDFGCGKGNIIEEMLRINDHLEITGSDVSGIALKDARKRIKSARFVRLIENHKLPFQDNYFDFIVALDVIEHIYDTELIFKDLARILKPNGLLLISVPYYGTLKNVLLSLFFFEVAFDPKGPHIRFFTKKSLGKCLREVGLTPLKWGYHGRFYPISNGMHVLVQKI